MLFHIKRGMGEFLPRQMTVCSSTLSSIIFEFERNKKARHPTS